MNELTKILKRFVIMLVLGLILVMPISAQSGNPADVVAAFLDAWNANDTGRMYSYLDPQSKAFYPQEVFQLRYKRAQEAMEFKGVTYTLGTSKTQGITAAVTYSVEIDAGAFGVIKDENRTMRLVWNGQNWGVAWSSMDIFGALTANSEISSSGRLPERAKIYDRNGNQIAGPGEVVMLVAQKQNMTDQAQCEIFLAELTRRPRIAFTQYFGNYAADTIIYIAEMNAETYYANQINLDPICGVIRVDSRTTRAYYGNNAMSHVTGWIGQMDASEQAEYSRRGYSSGDLIGKSGIEGAYEQTLAGTPDRILRITEPGGTVLAEFASTTGTNPIPVQLTIDRDLQLAVAQAMADAYDYANPNWGGVAGAGAAVVLDVNTGAILAMVSFPMVDPLLFDPTNPDPGRRLELLNIVTNDPRRPFFNHALEDQYTPGSVYKIISLAAILNEGAIAPTDTFDCQLEWNGARLGDQIGIRADWRKTDNMQPAGEITPAQALMASCNPFFWEYGGTLFQRNRKDMVEEYARRFGLGQAYNIYGTRSSVAGRVSNPQDPTSVISGAVGQKDVAIPPIQMAVAVAAVANGGTVYKPYLVEQIGGYDDTTVTQQFTPQQIGTLDLKPGVLETIRQGMCGAVEDSEYGTAWLRFSDRPAAPYTVCGKTGTAQTAQYPNAWFVSYAPKENPQIATVVMVSQSLEGSQIAAPITRRILDYYFSVPRNQWAPFPDWWAVGPYTPLNIPEGGTGG